MQKLVIYCDYETVTQSHKLNPIGRNVITQKQHPRNQTNQSKSHIPLCSIFTLFSTFPNKRFNPLILVQKHLGNKNNHLLFIPNVSALAYVH